MTLLYMDGFAHGQAGRYIAGAPTLNYAQTASPRTSNGYYATFSTGGDLKRAVTASAETFTGLGVKPTGAASLISFWGDAGATQHVTIAVNGSGLLEARRGSSAGTLLATGTTVIAANAWRYVEARVTIADSGGIVQVRVNGATTPDIDFTGDTKNAGTNTTVDAVSTSNAASSVADWYILNALGAVKNTWLGDVAVRTLTPSGDGTSSQLVGSDGNSVNNYQQADEIPPSSADYNGSSTVGQKDTYIVTDLPAAVTTVHGVQVAALMAKSDAGAASAKVVTRVAGTDYAPDTTTLSTTYTETIKLWETSPATSTAWSVAEVNGMEIGMEVA